MYFLICFVLEKNVIKTETRNKISKSKNLDCFSYNLRYFKSTKRLILPDHLLVLIQSTDLRKWNWFRRLELPSNRTKQKRRWFQNAESRLANISRIFEIWTKFKWFELFYFYPKILIKDKFKWFYIILHRFQGIKFDIGIPDWIIFF